MALVIRQTLLPKQPTTPKQSLLPTDQLAKDRARVQQQQKQRTTDTLTSYFGVAYGKPELVTSANLNLTKALATVKKPLPFADKTIKEVASEGLRRGTVRTASAVESGLGALAKRASADQLATKLETLAAKDAELARVGVEVVDPRRFREKVRDPKFVVNLLAETIPTMFVSYGVAAPLALIGAPAGAITAAAFAGAGLLEGGFAYQDAKEFGADEEFAGKVGAAVGIINGLIETIPVTKLYTRTPAGRELKRSLIRNITRRIVQQAAYEGGTEPIQELVSNAIAQTYDENRPLFQGVPEAALAGSLLGGGSSIALDVVGQVDTEIRTDRPGFVRIPGGPKDVSGQSNLNISKESVAIPGRTAAEEMKTAAQQYGQMFEAMNEKLDVRPDGALILRHGTSTEKASQILNSGTLTDGNFTAATERSAIGEEGAQFYAKYQHGRVLDIAVDPRSVIYDSTEGAFHAVDTLRRGSDGVWRAEGHVAPEATPMTEGLVAIDESTNTTQYLNEQGKITLTKGGYLPVSLGKSRLSDISQKMERLYPGQGVDARIVAEIDPSTLRGFDDLRSKANTVLVEALAQPAVSGAAPVAPTPTAVQKLTQAVKEAKPLRNQQERIYTEERAKRLARALAVGERGQGERGVFAQL